MSDKQIDEAIQALERLRQKHKDNLDLTAFRMRYACEPINGDINIVRQALERQRGPIKAKTIEWEHRTYGSGGQEWAGSFGFVIEFNPKEDQEFRYYAAWGEETEHFGTLAEAQEWCQHEVDCVVAQLTASTPEDEAGGNG